MLISTRRFRKDVRRLQKSGRDLKKLQAAVDVLVAGAVLPASYRDHALRGGFEGTRACHIAPNWLLRYGKNEGQLILLLISTGDHRRVLGIE